MDPDAERLIERQKRRAAARAARRGRRQAARKLTDARARADDRRRGLGCFPRAALGVAGVTTLVVLLAGCQHGPADMNNAPLTPVVTTR